MILALLIIVLYFLPSISAYSRKKRNASSILVVNFFLGWTVIGWVVALSWALAKDAEKPTVVVKAAEPTPKASDELIRLFKLKQDGVITEEEFAAHKEKLLS